MFKYLQNGACSINVYISEAVLRQFRGRVLLCNDEVLGTCDGEHGFVRRVSKKYCFIRGILGIRGPPQAFPMLALLSKNAVWGACDGEHAERNIS